MGLIGGETHAHQGLLAPWIAMWAVNIMLASAGLHLALRMGRESATGRGADFEEVLAAVVNRFRRGTRWFPTPLIQSRRGSISATMNRSGSTQQLN